MIGICKSQIDDLAFRSLDIRRHEEPVHRQPQLPFLIRPVGISARSHRSLRIDRRDQLRSVASMRSVRMGCAHV